MTRDPLAPPPISERNESSSSLFVWNLELPTLSQAMSLTSLGLSSLWILFSILFCKATPLAQAAHPAAALLGAGAALHGLLLLQGTRAALASLVHEGAQEDDATLLFQSSHAITYTLVHKVVQHNKANQGMERFHTGAQVLTIALLMCLVPCTIVVTAPPPSDKEGMLLLPSTTISSWLVTCTSLLCLAVSLACATRLAVTQATACRLDWLNTPVLVGLVQVALWVEASGLCHAVYVLRYAWQSFAEKPDKQVSSSSTWQGNIAFGVRALVSLMLTSLASAVVAWHVWGTHGLLGMVLVPCLMLLVGILQGIPLAAEQLNAREQQAALTDSTQHWLTSADAKWGRDLASLLLLSTLAVLASPQDWSHEWPGAVAWRLGSAVLCTAVVVSTVQAVAQAFPVAFLTQCVVDRVVQVSSRLHAVSAAATVLQGLCHTHYQDDAVYIGTAEERLAYKQRDLEAPAAAFAPQRIASYPPTTNNPQVHFEEHAL